MLIGSNYFNNYENITTEILSWENIVFLVAIIGITIGLLLFRKRVEKHDFYNVRMYDFYSNMFVIFGLIKFISIFTIELVDRLAIYFVVAVLFIAPIILNTFKLKYRKCLYVCMFIFLTVFLYFVLVIRGSYGVVPYKFIF